MTDALPARVEYLPPAKPSTFDLVPDAWALAEKIARTEFVPGALRGKPDAIMACVLAGSEMDVKPMTALRQIHVIDGRPTMSAELMRAVVVSHGHDVWVEESSSARATVCGQRAGSSHTQRITWTTQDAERAQLAGKQNWRRYPRQMLVARATAELCRLLAPDVLAGLSYSTEEVEDGFDFDQVEPEPEPVGEVRSLPKPKAKATKRTAKAKPAPKRGARTAVPPVEPDAIADEVEAIEAAGLPFDESEPVDAEVIEDDPDVLARARRIAMRANDLGLDHHDVIAAVTGGSERSAKAIDQAQADAVLDALRRIRLGEVDLDVVDGRPVLLDHVAPVADPDVPDVGDIDAWSADEWRAWLRPRGLKVGEVLREAQRIASETGDPEPVTLTDLRGSVAVLVAEWADRIGGDDQ